MSKKEELTSIFFNPEYNFSVPRYFFDPNNDGYQFIKFTDKKSETYNPKFYKQDSSEKFELAIFPDDIEYFENVYNEYFGFEPNEEEYNFYEFKKSFEDTKKFQGFSFAELFYEELPPIKWIVPNLIPAQGLTQLGAKRKVGKTWFCLELAAAVMTGGTFLGSPIKQGKVLYIDFESSKQILQERMSHYITEKDKESFKNLVFYNDNILTLKGNNEDDFISQLKLVLKDHPDTNLIIIDTIKYIRTSSMKKDVNIHDTQEMKPLHDFCDNNPQLTILFTNHLNKLSTEDPFDSLQGSSSIAGSTDTNIVIMQDDYVNGIPQKTKLLTQGRYSTNESKVIKFIDFHYQVIGDLDEVNYLNEKNLFINKPIVRVIEKLVKENDGEWQGQSKPIVDRIRNEFGVKYSSQQVAKELNEISDQLQECLSIFYKPIKREKSSIIHKFTKDSLQEDFLRDPEFTLL